MWDAFLDNNVTNWEKYDLGYRILSYFSWLTGWWKILVDYIEFANYIRNINRIKLQKCTLKLVGRTKLGKREFQKHRKEQVECTK